MKTIFKSFKLAYLLLIGVVLTTSCEDMLMPPNDRASHEFGKDSLYSYWGILSSTQKLAARTVLLGSTRSDLVQTTDYTSDSISAIANFENPDNGSSALLQLSDYYKSINMCNFYLQNHDTTLVRYNQKINLREYAQVQILRAWLYMNLVNNYGSVPYVTDPIDATNTNIENNAPRVNKDNLLEELQKAGLTAALETQRIYGIPNYGSINTGASSISGKLLAIDGRLVMGDLYLMRGASQSDYEQAATAYYDYLSTRGSYNYLADNYAPSHNVTITNGLTTNSFLPARSRAQFEGYSEDVSQSVIPLAGSTFFGNVVTDIANVYGFSTQTRNQTVAINDTAVSSSGFISVTPMLKMRQLAPSKAFAQLAAAQPIYLADPKLPGKYNEPTINDRLADIRYEASSPELVIDGVRNRFIGKMTSVSGDRVNNSSFSFHYAVNIYRNTPIILRYAEAINRAGFPAFAYAILRNGFSGNNLPTLSPVDIILPTDTIAVETLDGEEIVMSDSIVYDTIHTMQSVPNANSETQITYIPVSELSRAKGKSFLPLAGKPLTLPSIMAMGVGSSIAMVPDSLYRVSSDLKRMFVGDSLRQAAIGEQPIVGNQPVNFGIQSFVLSADSLYNDSILSLPANPIAINIVEDLICDQMALDMAYEGTRFTDLIRIASHKNNDKSGVFAPDFGTKWMAWKIARRAVDLPPFAEPSQYDQSIYQKLTNQQNWYFPIPVYN